MISVWKVFFSWAQQHLLLVVDWMRLGMMYCKHVGCKCESQSQLRQSSGQAQSTALNIVTVKESNETMQVKKAEGFSMKVCLRGERNSTCSIWMYCQHFIAVPGWFGSALCVHGHQSTWSRSGKGWWFLLIKSWRQVSERRGNSGFLFESLMLVSLHHSDMHRTWHWVEIVWCQLIQYESKSKHHWAAQEITRYSCS